MRIRILSFLVAGNLSLTLFMAGCGFFPTGSTNGTKETEKAIAIQQTVLARQAQQLANQQDQQVQQEIEAPDTSVQEQELALNATQTENSAQITANCPSAVDQVVHELLCKILQQLIHQGV